jgi:hypothetical protein
MGQSVNAEPRIIEIDRTKPFDPAILGHRSWSVVEQDERALKVTRLDLDDVRLVTVFGKEETLVGGEEKIRRLKETGFIRLDARAFQEIWKNRALIPEWWKSKVVFFDGTVLRRPDEKMCIFCIYWINDHWDSNYITLDNFWNDKYPSAVLSI